MPRKFYNERIEYENLNEELASLKEDIIKEDRKPLLDLEIFGGDFVSSDIYDIIKETLGEHVLNLRPNFKPDRILDEEKGIENGKVLDPRTLLREKIDEKYGWDELSDLSVDLLENLSSKKINEAKYLSKEFYAENFMAEEIEEDES